MPGVASLVWFEEWGARGIRSSSGAPLPAAEAIEALSRLDGELLWGDSPDGLVWAIGARGAGGTAVLVANLSRGTRDLTVDTPDGTVSTTVAAASFTRTVL